jgi:hypothetical protein
MSLEVDPFGAPPPGEPAPDLDRVAWEVMIAALRPVAVSVRHLAEAELMRPSWRPGETVEEAAFREGRKRVWRDLIAALERGT